jgi:phosphatidate cytidylyltransferase
MVLPVCTFDLAPECILNPGMKRVLTALVLIPLVLFLVFLGPKWDGLFTLVTAGVAMLAAWEYLGLAVRGGANPPRLAVILAVLLLFSARILADSLDFLRQTDVVFGALALALLVFCAFRSPVERVMADASASIFCLLYIGLTMSALPALHEDAEGNGPSLLTFLFCVVWAGDVAALYVGRAWGRRKLAPSLSPNKTWLGSIASIAGSLLITEGLLELSAELTRLNFARLSFPSESWYWFAMAVLVNIAAQVGDLAESALKRSVGAKDSGTILPGHGGILDRIDALLLAAPVLWYARIVGQRF